MVEKVRKKKISASQIILLLFVIILCISVLYPFYLLLIKSVKDYEQDVFSPLAITMPFHFENFQIAWEYVKGSILNSFIVSISCALLSVILPAMGGFAFSRYKFKGKNVLYGVILALMMVPSILILTTKFVLVSVTLGMHNTFIGVILPTAAGLIPFGILLLRGFFDSLPKDLFDAADVDGANSFTQFIRILLPLSIPMLTTLFLMNFMTSWNDYLWPLMILRDESMFTIPVQLTSFTDYFFKMTQYYAPPLAGYVIVAVPILVLFGFTSKQFIAGMTSGAIKM